MFEYELQQIRSAELIREAEPTARSARPAAPAARNDDAEHGAPRNADAGSGSYAPREREDVGRRRSWAFVGECG